MKVKKRERETLYITWIMRSAALEKLAQSLPFFSLAFSNPLKTFNLDAPSS